MAPDTLSAFPRERVYLWEPFRAILEITPCGHKPIPLGANRPLGTTAGCGTCSTHSPYQEPIPNTTPAAGVGRVKTFGEKGVSISLHLLFPVAHKVTVRYRPSDHGLLNQSIEQHPA